MPVASLRLPIRSAELWKILKTRETTNDIVTIALPVLSYRAAKMLNYLPPVRLIKKNNPLHWNNFKIGLRSAVDDL